MEKQYETYSAGKNFLGLKSNKNASMLETIFKLENWFKNFGK